MGEEYVKEMLALVFRAMGLALGIVIATVIASQFTRGVRTEQEELLGTVLEVLKTSLR